MSTPRNVRPSWLAVHVDGKIRTATGPRARTGNLESTLYVRESGSVLPLLEMSARATEDGRLVFVSVVDKRDGRVIFEGAFKQ